MYPSSPRCQPTDNDPILTLYNDKLVARRAEGMQFQNHGHYIHAYVLCREELEMDEFVAELKMMALKAGRKGYRPWSMFVLTLP